jgi:hypothetical protein
VDVHLFPLLGGPFTGNSEFQLKRGSKMGHPSFWELFKRNLEGGPFPGALKVMKEGSGDGHLSSWGSGGQPGVGIFVLCLKGALGVERLTLWELC